MPHNFNITVAIAVHSYALYSSNHWLKHCNFERGGAFGASFTIIAVQTYYTSSACVYIIVHYSSILVIVPPSAPTPTMRLLTKWKVLSSVAAKWRGLADLLDFDPSVTSAIDGKHKGDPELSCRDVFSRWLTGETGSAPSWGDLLEALDDLNYKVLADDLRSKLGA